MNTLKNLETIRVQRGVLQQELAAQLGVSQQMISLLEKGIKDTSVTNLILMAEYLDCSLDELTGFKFSKKED